MEQETVVSEQQVEGAVRARITPGESIQRFKKLGREIRISPKACATINGAGIGMKFYTETVTVLIGIGRDHTATLIMDKEAWEALNNGEPLDITTIKEFKEKHL